MTEQAFVPAQVFHPAEIIREELLARGWNLDTLAARSVLDPFTREEWATERLGWELYMGIAGSPEGEGMRLGGFAAGLERAFGISEKLWLATEQLWRNATPEQRSPPPDMEDLLSQEIAKSLGALCDKIEAERHAGETT